MTALWLPLFWYAQCNNAYILSVCISPKMFEKALSKWQSSLVIFKFSLNQESVLRFNKDTPMI